METWRQMPELMQITESPTALAFWARFVDYLATNTCSEWTIETLEKGGKYVQSSQ